MRLESPPLDFASLFKDPERVPRAYEQLPKLVSATSGYRPWRKVRAIANEQGVDPIVAWTAVKMLRLSSRRELDLEQASGKRFCICIGNDLLEPLFRVDRAMGGGGPALTEAPDGLLSSEVHRTRLQIRSLMEEAAESSIIEGAVQTRQAAVEMIRADRKPRNTGERMVMNNYLAMQHLKRLQQRDLSPEVLKELQGILTEGTLESADQEGRFRRPGERVVVEDRRTGEATFEPPAAEMVEARIKALCVFANREHRGSEFLHPIVKASILHFLIGYEHPWVDGNGRTARAVFYWYALRHGYKIFEYMPISERIRVGVARYAHAFEDTEMDEGDLTYFVLYKLEVIEQALDRFAEHIREEERRLVQSERFLKLSKSVNLRQQLLLEHGMRHPDTVYSVESHMNSHAITAATARKDLDDLVRKRMLVASKDGKRTIYRIAPGLVDRLARIRK